MNLHKRVICALTGLVCVTLLTSCTPHSDGTHPVTITDAGNTSDLVSPPIQTDTGWEVTFPETATTARALCARTSGAATYFKTQISRPGGLFIGVFWFPQLTLYPEGDMRAACPI